MALTGKLTKKLVETRSAVSRSTEALLCSSGTDFLLRGRSVAVLPEIGSN